MSLEVRVNADIEDVSSIYCQHSDQVTDRFAIQAQAVAKIIIIFNACSELKLGPGVI